MARRLNSLRGGRATNSKQKSVTAQLYSVMESGEFFREACSSATLVLSRSRRDGFDCQKHGWLTGDAEAQVRHGQVGVAENNN